MNIRYFVLVCVVLDSQESELRPAENLVNLVVVPWRFVPNSSFPCPENGKQKDGSNVFDGCATCLHYHI